jgi:hypothetical protein
VQVGVVLRRRDGSACCVSRGRFRILLRGAELPQTAEHNESVILKSAEEYRMLAAESVREAEALPEGLRLCHVTIAQLWLKLADSSAPARNRGRCRGVRPVDAVGLRRPVRYPPEVGGGAFSLRHRGRSASESPD